MRVLLVHNYYRMAGGEDAAFEDEARLLRDHGHEVIKYTTSNNALPAGSLAAARTALWSKQSYRELRELMGLRRPEVAHFHNTFLMISPSAYYACAEMRIPVVQTLHNYRLICPAATLFREGRVCEDCPGTALALPAVQHACYRHSRAQSAVVSSMLAFHHFRGTWRDRVDAYIALTHFSRRKFVEGGLPQDRIVVKPNFAFESDEGSRAHSSREFALFVGRLSPEKGLTTLLQAWEAMDGIPLVIVGDGPMRPQVESFCISHSDVRYVGPQEPLEARRLMRSARMLVVPSICYENFPRVLVESFESRTPVVASRLGALQELVRDGETGLLIAPGNVASWRSAVQRVWNDAAGAARMGEAARRDYELKFSPEPNYHLLTSIYEHVAGQKTM